MSQRDPVEQCETPTRNTKKRSWCFTWNNYTDDDIKYLVGILSKNGNYLFGEEIGNSGTPHLQGVFRFNSPRSFDSIKKLLKNNHFEPCKNWNASLNYCSKDGETFTNIENKKKRKNRLLEKYDNVIWKDWQEKVINICESDPDDRSINWIFDEDGNVGKSFLAKYLVLKYDAIIADGKKDNVFNQVNKWFQTHKDHELLKLVILDIPRYNCEYINYGVLEQLKNGMIYSGKYEGGINLFESPHVVVFSNFEPDYEKMSKDRWKVIEI